MTAPTDLTATLAAIGPADAAAMVAARDLPARLTKPPGSLGVLEDVPAGASRK